MRPGRFKKVKLEKEEDWVCRSLESREIIERIEKGEGKGTKKREKWKDDEEAEKGDPKVGSGNWNHGAGT